MFNTQQTLSLTLFPVSRSPQSRRIWATCLFSVLRASATGLEFHLMLSNVIATVTSAERYGDIKDLPKPHICYVANLEFAAVLLEFKASYSSKVSKRSQNCSSINFINLILSATKTFSTFSDATQNPRFQQKN